MNVQSDRTPNCESAKTVQPAVCIRGIESPEQLVGLVKNEQLRELLKVVAFNKEPPHDGRPKWAIRAAREMIRSAIVFPRSKGAKSESYRLGYLFGFVAGFRPTGMPEETEIMEFFHSSEFTGLVHSSIQTDPSCDAAEFYAGFSEGIKRSNQVSLSAPSLVFAVLAFGWKEAAKFNNASELQRWLGSIMGHNLAGSRDRIAKLCQKIGFPLTDRGGRPKKKPGKPTPS